MKQKVFRAPETGREICVTFRPFHPADAAGFHACIDDYYRGGYPYVQYFESGYLWRMVQEGKMAVFLGEDGAGTIVSTTAVLFDSLFPGSALLLLRVVREAFQGMGIGSWQEKILFEELEKHRGFSLYADVMTQNVTSQTSLERKGFITTGLRLLLYRADLMLPERNYPAGSRLSQAVMCRKGEKTRSRRLYCPESLLSPVSRIYDALGVCADLSADAGQAEGRSVISETFEAEHLSLIWIVSGIGKDFPERLSRELATGSRKKAVFLVYLNLSSKGAREGFEALDRSGFFFSGIKPLGRGEEYLMMTALFGIPLQSDCLHLTEKGQALLREIMELSSR